MDLEGGRANLDAKLGLAEGQNSSLRPPWPKTPNPYSAGHDRDPKRGLGGPTGPQTRPNAWSKTNASLEVSQLGQVLIRTPIDPLTREDKRKHGWLEVFGSSFRSPRGASTSSFLLNSEPRPLEADGLSSKNQKEQT